MKPEAPLDYAVFQLSPKRSRCELFVSSNGNTERLASGLIKPFVTHLKVAEVQIARSSQYIKLEVERHRNAETWFTKGTLERFVRYVSTPEVLEMVNTCDAEMSQLEAARKIYSQGVGDQPTGTSGRDGPVTIAAADETKNELLRALDVRLVAVRQDLTSACARATAAGFNPETVSELQHFADRFGANRLNEACSGFNSVCQRRADLINHTSSWKTGVDDRVLRGSDMSVEGPTEDHHILSTCQPPTTPTLFPIIQQRAPDVTKDDNNVVKEDEGTIQQQQPTRRLSVQDRISLFENKQKESSGGKPPPPAVVLPKSSELRRLSSDVSSSSSSSSSVAPGTAPAAVVLRRWSGATDMSIDLSIEKKEVDNSSPICTTPSSSSVSLNQSSGVSSIDKDRQSLNDDDTVNSAKAEVKSIGLRDHASEQNQFRSFLGRAEHVGLNDQTVSHEKLKVAGGEEGRGTKEQSKFQNRVEDVPLGDKPGEKSRIGVSLRTTTEAAPKNKNQFVSQLHSQSLSEKLESLTEPKAQEVFPVKKEEIEIDSLKDSENQKMKKSQVRKGDERSSSFGSRRSVFPVKKMAVDNDESYNNSVLVAPEEQVQRVRQSKGNQELNDELKLKANELEKLFAEHKLRGPGEQSSSSRRSKPSHMQTDPAPEFPYKATSEMTPEQLPKSNSSHIKRQNSSPVLKTPDILESGEIMHQNFSELSISDSRGKLYDAYTQKRDAKLKEEWGTKRPEKEAKMKAMQDSLERSRSELIARFAVSADRKNSVSNARLRTEKLRSFNLRSNTKEQPIDYMQYEEDGDLLDLQEKPFGQDRLFSETTLVDGTSRTTQGRKFLPGKNLPSSTTRTSTAPVPRSSTKASNSHAGRRRPQSENPLAQSVPNFSDLKKEYTKPSSGVIKTTPRLQVRNHSRSKSNSEDISLVKEEKTRRPPSLRKSSVGHSEFKETTLNSDANVEAKPFLRKGSGIGPGSGANLAKLKASMTSDALPNEEESEELAFEPEDSVDMVKENYDEESEAEAAEMGDMDNGKPSASQESDKSGDSGSENGDALRSLSSIDPASVAELPVILSSAFHPLGILQDSPGESPLSWNSRMHHSFSYPHEISDVDASVDSPIGSPAYWNSHSIVQTEADAAGMRKKWGSAHKPIFGANSSSNQSRKDMAKGFKRLLKFGRKSRGTDSLADWISATTSEGDDDTEDGRDLANRSSEDLRKSRMGFSQSHTSLDGFHESEMYSEQVQSMHSSIPAPQANFKMTEDHLSGSSLKAPRSFFSLSSFRSKGHDSRPR